MGWWDVGIMDGDTPGDVWDGIKDFLETPPAPVEEKKGWIYRSNELVRRRHMEGRLLDVEQFMLKKWSDATKYRNIVYEVLGFQAMSRGVTIPDELRERIITAARTDLDSVGDNWTHPNERRRMLREFVYHLELYETGRPVQLQDVGLFEVGAERLRG